MMHIMLPAVFDPFTPSHDLEDMSAKRPQDVIRGASVHHRSPSIFADQPSTAATATDLMLVYHS